LPQGIIAGVNPLSRTRAFICWLVLFFLGAIWIARQEYVDQYERFFQSTSIAEPEDGAA